MNQNESLRLLPIARTGASLGAFLGRLCYHPGRWTPDLFIDTDADDNLRADEICLAAWKLLEDYCGSGYIPTHLSPLGWWLLKVIGERAKLPAFPAISDRHYRVQLSGPVTVSDLYTTCWRGFVVDLNTSMDPKSLMRQFDSAVRGISALPPFQVGQNGMAIIEPREVELNTITANIQASMCSSYTDIEHFSHGQQCPVHLEKHEHLTIVRGHHGDVAIVIIYSPARSVHSASRALRSVPTNGKNAADDTYQREYSGDSRKMEPAEPMVLKALELLKKETSPDFCALVSRYASGSIDRERRGVLATSTVLRVIKKCGMTLPVMTGPDSSFVGNLIEVLPEAALGGMVEDPENKLRIGVPADFLALIHDPAKNSQRWYQLEVQSYNTPFSYMSHMSALLDLGHAAQHTWHVYHDVVAAPGGKTYLLSEYDETVVRKQTGLEESLHWRFVQNMAADPNWWGGEPPASLADAISIRKAVLNDLNTKSEDLVKRLRKPVDFNLTSKDKATKAILWASRIVTDNALPAPYLSIFDSLSPAGKVKGRPMAMLPAFSKHISRMDYFFEEMARASAHTDTPHSWFLSSVAGVLKNGYLLNPGTFSSAAVTSKRGEDPGAGIGMVQRVRASPASVLRKSWGAVMKYYMETLHVSGNKDVSPAVFLAPEDFTPAFNDMLEFLMGSTMGDGALVHANLISDVCHWMHRGDKVTLDMLKKACSMAVCDPFIRRAIMELHAWTRIGNECTPISDSFSFVENGGFVSIVTGFSSNATRDLVHGAYVAHVAPNGWENKQFFDRFGTDKEKIDVGICFTQPAFIPMSTIAERCNKIMRYISAAVVWGELGMHSLEEDLCGDRTHVLLKAAALGRREVETPEAYSATCAIKWSQMTGSNGETPYEKITGNCMRNIVYQDPFKNHKNVPSLIGAIATSAGAHFALANQQRHSTHETHQYAGSLMAGGQNDRVGPEHPNHTDLLGKEVLTAVLKIEKNHYQTYVDALDFAWQNKDLSMCTNDLGGAIPIIAAHCSPDTKAQLMQTLDPVDMDVSGSELFDLLRSNKVDPAPLFPIFGFDANTNMCLRPPHKWLNLVGNRSFIAPFSNNHRNARSVEACAIAQMANKRCTLSAAFYQDIIAVAPHNDSTEAYCNGLNLTNPTSRMCFTPDAQSKDQVFHEIVYNYYRAKGEWPKAMLDLVHFTYILQNTETGDWMLDMMRKVNFATWIIEVKNGDPKSRQIYAQAGTSLGDAQAANIGSRTVDLLKLGPKANPTIVDVMKSAYHGVREGVGAVLGAGRPFVDLSSAAALDVGELLRLGWDMRYNLMGQGNVRRYPNPEYADNGVGHLPTLSGAAERVISPILGLSSGSASVLFSTLTTSLSMIEGDAEAYMPEASCSGVAFATTTSARDSVEPEIIQMKAMGLASQSSMNAVLSPLFVRIISRNPAAYMKSGPLTRKVGNSEMTLVGLCHLLGTIRLYRQAKQRRGKGYMADAEFSKAVAEARELNLYPLEEIENPSVDMLTLYNTPVALSQFIEGNFNAEMANVIIMLYKMTEGAMMAEHGLGSSRVEPALDSQLRVWLSKPTPYFQAGDDILELIRGAFGYSPLDRGIKGIPNRHLCLVMAARMIGESFPDDRTMVGPSGQVTGVCVAPYITAGSGFLKTVVPTVIPPGHKDVHRATIGLPQTAEGTTSLQAVRSIAKIHGYGYGYQILGCNIGTPSATSTFAGIDAAIRGGAPMWMSLCSLNRNDSSTVGPSVKMPKAEAPTRKEVLPYAEPMGKRTIPGFALDKKIMQSEAKWGELNGPLHVLMSGRVVIRKPGVRGTYPTYRLAVTKIIPVAVASNEKKMMNEITPAMTKMPSQPTAANARNDYGGILGALLALSEIHVLDSKGVFSKMILSNLASMGLEISALNEMFNSLHVGRKSAPTTGNSLKARSVLMGSISRSASVMGTQANLGLGTLPTHSKFVGCQEDISPYVAQVLTSFPIRMRVDDLALSAVEELGSIPQAILELLLALFAGSPQYQRWCLMMSAMDSAVPGNPPQPRDLDCKLYVREIPVDDDIGKNVVLVWGHKIEKPKLYWTDTRGKLQMVVSPHACLHRGELIGFRTYMADDDGSIDANCQETRRLYQDRLKWARGSLAETVLTRDGSPSISARSENMVGSVITRHPPRSRKLVGPQYEIFGAHIHPALILKLSPEGEIEMRSPSWLNEYLECRHDSLKQPYSPLRYWSWIDPENPAIVHDSTAQEMSQWLAENPKSSLSIAKSVGGIGYWQASLLDD